MRIFSGQAGTKQQPCEPGSKIIPTSASEGESDVCRQGTFAAAFAPSLGARPVCPRRFPQRGGGSRVSESSPSSSTVLTQPSPEFSLVYLPTYSISSPFPVKSSFLFRDPLSFLERPPTTKGPCSYFSRWYLDFSSRALCLLLAYVCVLHVFASVILGRLASHFCSTPFCRRISRGVVDRLGDHKAAFLAAEWIQGERETYPPPKLPAQSLKGIPVIGYRGHWLRCVVRTIFWGAEVDIPNNSVELF
ncbi:hypothetical protein FN846DRAFT_142696 [Sphaerosporella brunnea]|uniref:Uncharacterized protein n=1 Tax=Sphaerosporella brunnea TaxID=1250544 RepID=A0A5J5EQU6_9PEZI|nr:hypothetical protein FN846DRAFT_142696 [Sphaerosporella brunnea]